MDSDLAKAPFRHEFVIPSIDASAAEGYYFGLVASGKVLTGACILRRRVDIPVWQLTWSAPEAFANPRAGGVCRLGLEVTLKRIFILDSFLIVLKGALRVTLIIRTDAIGCLSPRRARPYSRRSSVCVSVPFLVTHLTRIHRCKDIRGRMHGHAHSELASYDEHVLQTYLDPLQDSLRRQSLSIRSGL